MAAILPQFSRRVACRYVTGVPRLSRAPVADRPWPPPPRVRPARAMPALPPDLPRRPRLRWRWLRRGIIAAIWGTLALALFLLAFAWDLPRPEAALGVRRPYLTLEASDGRVVATYGDVVGETLHLADLPPSLPQAVTAIEDRRFWWHPGIDPLGIARALVVNLRAGRTVQGGSTLTQQVAKNLFLSNARTFRRKVQEVLLTLWLEHRFSKRQIMEIWLNRIYLGAGVFGVDAAARTYFGSSARHLSLWQSAMLAGLARAPSRFNPRTSPDVAALRTRQVLAAMVAAGDITAAQAEAAAAQIAPAPRPASAGWFADWIMDQAAARIPPDQDAVVRTTLDSGLQAAAERDLAALLDGPGRAADVGQGAVVAIEAASGAVRAMVGGRDYRTGPYNRAVLARRQPGSAFKPFVWLAALETGMTPDDRVEDAPIRIGPWSPANDDHRFRGEVSVEDGLAWSLNTVSVRLLLAAGGPHAVVATARRLGIASRLPENPSLALGTGEVGLLELAGAYAAFFNGGMRAVPHGITALRLATPGGLHPAALPPPVAERVIEPAQAAAMARMLAAVVARGTGQAAALPGRAVGGKTGTTQDSRDAWFIGCTGGLVIGVWLGNDDNHPMRDVMGGGLPARLFHAIAAGR
jgi:penicillin-binding protein 1A